MDKAPEAFRTISEVADEIDVPQHVLRFWESRFTQIRPMKRGGGRRFYRPEDVDLLRGVRHLLYGEGYTIRGVQRILREQGPRFVQAVWQEGAPQPPVGEPDQDRVHRSGLDIKLGAQVVPVAPLVRALGQGLQDRHRLRGRAKADRRVRRTSRGRNGTQARPVRRDQGRPRRAPAPRPHPAALRLRGALQA